MSVLPRASARLLKNLLAVVAVVVVVVAMIVDTKFLTPGEAADLNPPPFRAETYANETFPKVVVQITEKATDITVLAPAIDADATAAGKQYGTDVGSGNFAYAVKATGTVKTVDANFMLLTVPGLPAKDQVRIPLGSALSGTPVRDAPATITFSDFVGQTDFQSVANQFKIKMQTQVLAKIDAPSLKGKQLTVVGAWSTGGPPNSYIIQPVSIEVAP